AVQKYRFDCFGNAVAANAVGTVPRHQTDYQTADDRHEYYKISERVPDRRSIGETERLIKEKIRKKRDQFQEKECNDRAQKSDDDAEHRYSQDAFRCRKIAEFKVGFVRVFRC